MLNGRNGEIYHLSPDKGISVRDVVKTICDKMDIGFEKATKTVEERLGQDAAYMIDSEKARDEFGWCLEVSLEEGIAGVVRWIEDGWEDIQKEPLDYIHKA